MKIGKKLLSLLLSLLLLCGLFPSAALAEGSGEILLSNEEGLPGGSVDVELSFVTNPGVAVLHLQLQYDRGVLELESTELASETGWTLGTDESLLFDAYPDSSFTGKAATFHFRIREDAAPGQTEVGVLVEAYNSDEAAVSFEVRQGTVTVHPRPDAGSVSVVAVTALDSLSGPEVVPVSGSGVYAPGQTVTLSAPAVEGRSFQGWYLNGSLYSQQPDCACPITAESPALLKFVALYATLRYTVRFDANGHGTAPADQTVNHGAQAQRPADPAADSFRFLGWFTDAACADPYDFSAPVTGDLLLYAGWSFSGGEGQAGLIELGGAEGKPGDTVALPVSLVRNPGFMGLILTPRYDETVLELLGVDLETGANWDATDWGVITFLGAEDVFLTGKLASYRFRIREDAPLGETWVRLDAEACNYNDASVPFELVPARVNVRENANDGSVTVLALSALDSPQGQELEPVVGGGEYPVGETVFLQAPELNGYRFIGWFMNGEPFSEAPSCSITVTEDTPSILRFTAVYQKCTVSVHFAMLGHGEAPADQILDYGEPAVRPADPSAEFFDFQGWFTDAACTEEYDFSTPVTADLTLYALWQLSPSAGNPGLIRLTDAQGKPGETVTVELWVDQNPGVMALFMDLEFDPARLELLSVELNVSESWEAEDWGTVSYLGSNDSDFTGKIASYTFLVLDAPESCDTAVCVNASGCGQNENLVPFEISRSTVSIKVPANDGTVTISTRSALGSLDGEAVAETGGSGEYAVGQTAELSAGNAEGAVFQGWYLNGELYAETSECSYEVTDDSPEELLFVALYMTCSYTVSFDLGGHGTAIAAQTVNHGGLARRPVDPWESAYGFIDWYSDPAFAQAYDFSSPVTGNLTLYAKWYLRGDINGDGKVNNKDVTRLQKYLRGDDVFVVEAALDVNGNGTVNNKDLTRLQKYLRGEGVILH